jgi:putative Ca2+/H+ antiporter (TMEM165/GDT1 family)
LSALNTFLVSTGLVALAEIGDKTQLLSLVLAARFRRPGPIIAGIFGATLLNHALAGAVGAWITHWIGAGTLRWLLGLSFIAMAAWMLVPDRLDEDGERPTAKAHGVFLSTLTTFFFVEMGDKTQVATVALAARFSELWAVVAGTTLGMLLANVPVVLLGDEVTRRLPVRAIHVVAALVFLVLGIAVLLT